MVSPGLRVEACCCRLRLHRAGEAADRLAVEWMAAYRRVADWPERARAAVPALESERYRRVEEFVMM
jgi:hypothetical protein